MILTIGQRALPKIFYFWHLVVRFFLFSYTDCHFYFWSRYFIDCPCISPFFSFCPVLLRKATILSYQFVLGPPVTMDSHLFHPLGWRRLAHSPASLCFLGFLYIFLHMLHSTSWQHTFPFSIFMYLLFLFLWVCIFYFIIFICIFLHFVQYQGLIHALYYCVFTVFPITIFVSYVFYVAFRREPYL